MQEIKCPNCGTVFQVDESEYAQILRQVRDDEFKKELEYRAKDLAEKKETDLKLVRMEQEKKLGEIITSKDSELAKKDRMIEQLKMQIAGEKTERELAVSKAVQQKEKELSEKQTEIPKVKKRKRLTFVVEREKSFHFHSDIIVKAEALSLCSEKSQ